MKWYRKVAEQGGASAQLNLGLGYAKGQGVPQNYKEAVRLFRLSAEGGNASAQSNLGLMYFEGHGVPQDYTETVKWNRRSAEQGKVGGQYNMGVIYYNGYGVPKDAVLAYMWWDIAGSNRDKEGIKYRNKLEKRMTKQQIEKAQEMARNWRPTTK